MDDQVDISPQGAPILLLRLKRKILARHPLDKPLVTMGRGSRCDIVLDDSSGVSRLHAQILMADGEVMLEDMGSRNGTFVNSKIVKRRTLRPGDRIAIGDYRLHYLQAPRVAADEAPAGNPITELMRRWRGAAITVNRNECPLCGETGRHEILEESSESETGEHPHTIEGRPGGFTGLSENMVDDESPTTNESLNIDAEEALAAEPGEELDRDAFTVADDDPSVEQVAVADQHDDPHTGIGVDGVAAEVEALRRGVAEISAQLKELDAAEAAALAGDDLAAEDRAAEESPIDVFPPPSLVAAYGDTGDEYDEIMKKVSALVDQNDDQDVSAETSDAAEATDDGAGNDGSLPSLRSRLRRNSTPRRKNSPRRKPHLRR